MCDLFRGKLGRNYDCSIDMSLLTCNVIFRVLSARVYQKYTRKIFPVFYQSHWRHSVYLVDRMYPMQHNFDWSGREVILIFTIKSPEASSLLRRESSQLHWRTGGEFWAKHSVDAENSELSVFGDQTFVAVRTVPSYHPCVMNVD